MPLHLDAITNGSQDSSIFAWLLQEGMDECDAAFVTEDKKYIHMQRKIVDLQTCSLIGKVVYTIKVNEKEKHMEILDADIIWNNKVPTKLCFVELLEGSSESNEYFEVETTEEQQHLKVETVNRYTVKGVLSNTEREVFVSAFPFELSIFSNIRELNRWAGFGEGVTVGDTELTVEGLSERFVMPGGALDPDTPPDAHFSLVIGKVISFRDVKIAFGKLTVSFVLAQVDTALGVIPVAMNREVFDLSQLKVGCIVMMNADIKADVSKAEDFMRS